MSTPLVADSENAVSEKQRKPSERVSDRSAIYCVSKNVVLNLIAITSSTVNRF